MTLPPGRSRGHTPQDPGTWVDSVAFHEGLANARTGGWVTVIVFVVVAWLSAAAGVANSVDLSRLVQAEDEWVRAGAFVRAVQANDRAGQEDLSVAACEQLNAVEGITAAYAARSTDRTLYPASAPGTGLTLTLVSPGFFDFYAIEPSAGAVVMATRSGVTPTGLATEESTVFRQQDNKGHQEASGVAELLLVPDEEPLGPELAGSFIVPSLLDGKADTCYVRATDAIGGDMDAYLRGLGSPPISSPNIVRPFLSGQLRGVDFSAHPYERPIWWTWLAGGLAMVLMQSLLHRTRRGRHAIYRTYGASIRDLMVLQVTEWVCVSLPSITWGWGIGVALSSGLGSDPGVVLAQVTGQVVSLWCVATLGVVLLSLWPQNSLLSALKKHS